MTFGEVEKWIADNGTGDRIRKTVNGIDWLFVPMVDGWIAIFEYSRISGEYTPRIQASDLEKAESFIYMIEPVTIPLSPIVSE